MVVGPHGLPGQFVLRHVAMEHKQEKGHAKILLPLTKEAHASAVQMKNRFVTNTNAQVCRFC